MQTFICNNVGIEYLHDPFQTSSYEGGISFAVVVFLVSHPYNKTDNMFEILPIWGDERSAMNSRLYSPS